jgi:hypothetical protein
MATRQLRKLSGGGAASGSDAGLQHLRVKKRGQIVKELRLVLSSESLQIEASLTLRAFGPQAWVHQNARSPPDEHVAGFYPEVIPEVVKENASAHVGRRNLHESCFGGGQHATPYRGLDLGVGNGRAVQAVKAGSSNTPTGIDQPRRLRCMLGKRVIVIPQAEV